MTSKRIERNLEMITAVDMSLDAWREAGLFEQRHAELEYMALYHQLLTSCVRVSQLDPRSPVALQLAEDYEKKFPRFRENPYLPGMPLKHRLLLRLILKRHFGAVKALMDLNDRARRKDA